jgi:hypothetical protein
MSIRSFGAKTAYEEYYIAFGFLRPIDDGASIVSAAVVAYDADDVDKTSVLINAGKQIIGEKRVNVWVNGGTAQRYKIRCRVLTSTGEKYGQSGYLEVEAE